MTPVMWKVMLGGAGALVILGLAGYAASGGASVTALIPAFLGVPLGVLALLAARKESIRKHLMHAAMFLVALGALGSARGFAKLPALLAGSAERPLAIGMQLAMFVICACLLALGVRSFIAARTARAA